MIKRIKSWFVTQNDINRLISKAIASSDKWAYDVYKENQALAGRIKLLEEQQDIMHNFLVEINKYLVKLTEKDNGLRVNETKAKGKKANERR
jgi:hypothetical protein